MSWERFESWPGEGAGGAFRGSSEPVLAQCGGLSLAQRVRLFWRSSPDLPAGRIAERVMLTAAHVYAQRRDGTRERAPREALVGMRRDGPVLVVGVLDAEDLFVPWHARCPVEAALTEQLGRKGELRWQHGRLAGAVTAFIAGAWSIDWLREHPPARAIDHIAQGMFTSDAVLYAGGGILVGLVALLGLLWIPAWVRVDATGVEVRRGLIPWLPFRRPPEDFDGAGYRAEYGKGSVLVAYKVAMTLRERSRFASFWAVDHVQIGYVPAKDGNAKKRAEDLVELAQRIHGRP